MFAPPTLRSPRSTRRGHPLWLAVPLISLLAACDFPTELPKWDTTWVVPGESTTISVSSLLPSSITTSGNNFVLSLQPATFTQTLGQMCGGTCTALNGFTVPKPAFTTSFSSSISLPSDVVSAQVTGGQVRVVLSNNLGFDPIRPSAIARGHVVVTATAGSTVLARDSIAGESTAFTSGSTLTRTLTLGAATVSGPITIGIKVSSPEGDPVTINTNNSLSVTATPQTISVSQANVRVTNRAITGASVELDLADVDEEVTSRVKSGALLLTLVNPFAGTTGTLSVRIVTPSAIITKSVSLAAGTSSARVEFNQQEIQAILGSSPVTLSVSGTVSGPAAGVAVTPSQVVAISSRLELTVGPKED